MMKLEESLEVLAQHRTEEIVVPTMTVARLWPNYSRRHELDFPYVGMAMGHASDFALGIALAQPQRRVIALNGDGSMLMNLGNLVTVAHLAPPNYILMVFENEKYEITGGQPIPGVKKVDFPRIAEGAGFTRVYGFEEVEPFARQLPQILQERGPVFVNLKVFYTGKIPPLTQRPNIPEIGQRFKATLAGTAP
ncbi:MAG: thiamine pyrophosphate-binding protein [Nitrospinota bacterium]|nr:MAG: thiamine pyrophosphate-binding protein [Nitrospinota bacterium]